MICVKLGGSCITHKDRFETLDEPKLDAIVAQLKQLYDERKGRNERSAGFCLVHGAGSFGHHQAVKYGVSTGSVDNPVWIQGLVETRDSVVRLNGMVVGKLVAAGIPAVGVSPFPACTTVNKQLVDGNARFFIKQVGELLQNGFVPVLHGDAVLDSVLGCTILSGDVILQAVCETLRAEYAVFLTVVDGIYDRPPDTSPDAMLIRQIMVSANGEYKIPETDTAAHDSTGGISTKIKSAVEVAKGGTRVCIVKAGTSHAVAALRGGQPAVGTTIFSARGGNGGGRPAL